MYFIFGTVRDKEIDPILEIFPKHANYIFTEAHVPRALDADELSRIAMNHGLKGIVVREVNQAMITAKSEAMPNDLIFVGGSMFVVAEINDL